MSRQGVRRIVDGNEAAALIAHKLSEVIAIYPITPASPMGELADTWTQAGRANRWGTVPEVIEMQSEAGAAGTLHGALQAGSLATTFTASQGLLLMIPNLYKIAGELLPAVIHVAARSVATHALSIFGDHSDVMAVRQTGMAMLCATSVQEAHDLALIAHATTLDTRVPFIHFFDGFRTSHEIATIEALDDDTIGSLIDEARVHDHRQHGLNPQRPVLRGSAQNPDVFFQAREAANAFHAAVPAAVQARMDQLGELTGRRYRSIEYHGHPEATRVVIAMGSATHTLAAAADQLNTSGEAVGVLTVRLYRPFDAQALCAALPSTVQAIAVLDRTKEPGAPGEPLFLDVVAALAGTETPRPTIIGGRYGLSSKEFTPAMAQAVFAALTNPGSHHEFTIGINDDLTHLSLPMGPAIPEPPEVIRAVFHGLGSDGTVGANKNTVKIVGGNTDLHAQGYFVYDSKKSGSVTVSHLRFSKHPINAPYLIEEANFVGVHDFGAFDRYDVLRSALNGATVLINSPFDAAHTWEHLPAEAQHTIIERSLEVHVVDADAIARSNGLGGRTNTVLQTCFFALVGVIPIEDAIAAIKNSISSTYRKLGDAVLQRNFAAVDAARAGLQRMTVPAVVTSSHPRRAAVGLEAPQFVREVIAPMLVGDGDLLPVSALPVDGTFPTATTQWEKRQIASEIPIWDPEICIDCARCALVCPHAAIRLKVVDATALSDAPEYVLSREWTERGAPAGRSPQRSIIQVAPDDCTGCGVCVQVCPAKSKTVAKHKAINMEPITEHLALERDRFAFVSTLPEHDRTELNLSSVKGSQVAEPLFAFSGACAGCGETPYLKLVTQLFGDRMVVANATGCSSIYGGNLPTTPWAVNAAGHGPAWANSLFEDNAEFGLGIRLGLDQHHDAARALLSACAENVGDLAHRILDNSQSTESEIAAMRSDLMELRDWLQTNPGPLTERLDELADHLLRRSVWLIGGDGWAYDIGFGGVDHVLASGKDVNILVLDTEVYSNTGGQTSKSTPRAAVAKFSAGGKSTAKKDIGMIAMAYGDVYVAHIAMGANMTQTVTALMEAEAHRGPSIVIAYSPCIAHGIDMSQMMDHQKAAAESGHWPLYRYDPGREARGEHALHLDSRKPTMPFREFAMTEARFSMLARANPSVADTLMAAAQRDIDDRWHLYEQMVEVEHSATFGNLDHEEE